MNMNTKNIVIVIAVIVVAILAAWQFGMFGGSQKSAETPPAATTEPATPPAATTEPATPPAATTEPAATTP